MLHGIDENQVNVVLAEDFDFAGSWTAYTYSVVYDIKAEKVLLFEPIDTIEDVIFNRLIGFPSRAYRLSTFGEQNIWKDAVLNLDYGAKAYNVYWLGIDELEWVANATTYAETGIQFNIDVPDTHDDLDNNLFIELVRNNLSKD